MASLASEVSGTQMVEFFNRFGRFGGNMARLQKLLGDDELMGQWVKRLEEFQQFRLIHGVFNPAAEVLESFKARCTEKGVDFAMFSWVTPEQAPGFTDDPEVAVVLDATLGTLEESFDFAWEWAADGQESNCRWEAMVSDSKKLRQLSDDREDEAEGDGPGFKPWTLAWRRVKLDTNVGKAPEDVRDPKSPGCALLFLAAEHPERIKATDYRKRFSFWLPGLKCTAPGGRRWRCVPCVDFDRDDRQVELNSYWDGSPRGRLAMPVLWE